MKIFHLKKITIFSFAIIFIAMIFSPIKNALASSFCGCNLSSNDCIEVYLTTDHESAKGCELTCTANFKNVSSSNYGTDSDAMSKLMICQSAHGKFAATAAAVTEAKAAKPSDSTSTAPKVAAVIPYLNVAIPDLKFKNPIITEALVKSNFLADYLTALYKYLIGISITISIVLIMVAGAQYVLAAGGGDVANAKKRILNAISGFVILLSVYLILYTVNPQLTLLKSVELQNIQEVAMPEIDEGDVAEEGSTSSTSDLPAQKRLCHSVEECKKVCDNRSSIVMPNVNLPKIPNSTGIKNSGSATGTSELAAGLAKAGKIAAALNPNYTINIPGSECGYRSLKAQLDKACDSIKTNGGKSLTDGSLAWPGGSNHGNGIAVDIQLTLSGKNLMTMSKSASKDPKYKDPSDILSKIMNQAGFVRYGKEIWHFEIKGKAGSTCRCSYPNCKFPPGC